jgi:uncharacterized protein (TIGR02246 family)
MSGLKSLEPNDVHQFVRDWEAWFNDGDHATMAAFYAEDARLIATQTPTIRGRPAIAEFYRAACERTRAAGLRRTVHLEDVDCAGNLGYMRGTVRLSRAGESPATIVRHLTLWKQQSGGGWQLIEDISSVAPAEPDQFGAGTTAAMRGGHDSGDDETHAG